MNARIVKAGGANLEDPRFLDDLTRRIRALNEDGPVVLVHGGGKQISALQQRLGLDEHKHEGLRVTSREGMKAVAMVLAGRMNKQVTAHFVHAGLDALGISGADRGLLRAPFWGKGELGRVGDAPVVDTNALGQLLGLVDVLVVAPVCIGPDGGLMNVNADTVAQALAIAIGAEALELVTDVEAVRSADGPESQLNPTAVRRLIRERHVRGGMRPKMEAALAALEAGVGVVRVGNLASLQAGRCTEVRL
jgi:acetylglutamate kinase